MEEKIKIHLTKEVYETILKDCEAFEFYKINGELNKNAFLTKLINNYYKSYQEKENILISLIESEIKDSVKDYKDITIKIVNKLNKLESSPNKEKFNQIILHGPQIAYEKDEENTKIVKLTEKGKQLYKSHYVHRPNYDYVENDYYYFSCSYTHIKTYFRRFGKEAYIVSPNILQKDFIKFYKQAHESYQENGRLNKGE